MEYVDVINELVWGSFECCVYPCRLREMEYPFETHARTAADAELAAQLMEQEAAEDESIEWVSALLVWLE